MRLRTILESIKDLQARLESEFGLEELWISEGSRYVQVHNIRVRPKDRGRGVGSKVIEAIKDYAVSVDKRVILSSEHDRGKKGALARFYKRSGFRKPGRGKDFSLPRHTHIWRSE